MCFGISGSLVYSPATAVAGHWFLKRRSTAVGIIVAGSGLGGVIYPIMLKELLEILSTCVVVSQLTEAFRDTLFIIMCLNVVLMVPACFWVKGRLPPRTPPPLKVLKGPWKETRYVFLCVGVALYGFK
jgi:MFS family permease